MKDFLLTTAEETGVKFQYYCGKGGTDAGATHLKTMAFHQRQSASALATSTPIKLSTAWMTS